MIQLGEKYYTILYSILTDQLLVCVDDVLLLGDTIDIINKMLVRRMI
jgi:hypothetical protein